MAQSGIFHTSMRGFNKEEVLQYIEDLNARTTAECQAATEEVAQKQQENAGLKNQLSVCRSQLAKAEQNAEELQKLVDEYRITVRKMNEAEEQAAALNGEAASLRQEIETLNRERVALNARSVRAEQLAAEREQELSSLREKSEEWRTSAEKLSAQLAAEKRENEALRSHLRNAELTPEKRRYYEQLGDTCRKAVEENRRYRALIGHVGTFVAEVRQMNRTMLEDTCRQGADALARADSELETAVTQLLASRAALSDMQKALTERFEANDQRLSAFCDRLAQDMPDADDREAE